MQRTFMQETSEEEIPAFWEEYYGNEEYRKGPGNPTAQDYVSEDGKVRGKE